MERAEQVVALRGRDRRHVALPLLGEKQAGTELIEPRELELTQQEHGIHALGV